MTTEERLLKLLAASSDVLRRVDDILEGQQRQAQPAVTDCRLLDYRKASELLGVSRQTIRRMIHDGRLPVVEIRCGRFRVPSQALTEIVEAGLSKWGGPFRHHQQAS